VIDESLKTHFQMEGLKEGILVKAQQNAQLIHVLNQLEKNYKIEKAIKPIFLLRKVKKKIRKNYLSF